MTELRKVFAATKNPRVAKVTIEINGDFFRENQENDDLYVLKEILAYEGNFNSFVNLLSSLAVGYNPTLEMPYLINSNNEGEYIVVEGNRRILALKLLRGYLTLPSLEEIKVNSDDEASVEMQGDEIEAEPDARIKNYKKIIEVIKKYREENKANEENDSFKKILVNLIDDSDKVREALEIRVAVFSNHVTGRKIGKRNWNRGKTLSIYSDFLSSSDPNKTFKEKVSDIANVFSREKKDVISYIKSAQFIEGLLSLAGRDKEVFFEKNKVSSLEQQFVKKFVNSYKKGFYESQLKFEFSEEKQKYEFIWMNDDIDKEGLAKLILSALENNLFNTREVSEDAFEVLQDFFEKRNSKPIINSSGKVENITKIKRKDFKSMKIKTEDRNATLMRKMLNDLETLKVEKQIEHVFKISSPLVENPKYELILKAIDKQTKLLEVILDEKKYPIIEDMNLHAIASILRSRLEMISYLLMLDDEIFKSFSSKKTDGSYVKNFETIKKETPNSLKISDWTSSSNVFINSFETNFLHKVYDWFKLIKSGKDSSIKSSDLNYELDKAWEKLINNNSLKMNWDTIFSKDIFKNSSKLIHSPHIFEKSNSEIITVVEEIIKIVNALTLLQNKIIK